MAEKTFTPTLRVQMLSVFSSTSRWIVVALLLLSAQSAHADTEIYWVNEVGLFKSPSNGASADLILPSDISPNSIAIDTTNSKFIWADGEHPVLWRSNLDATNMEVLIDNSFTPEVISVAVDNLNGHIYWTTGFNGNIARANLDGTGSTNIVTGLTNPRAIAVHPTDQKVYWSDANDNKIMRANFDGTAVEDIITVDAATVDGIALDMTNSKIYWHDVSNTQIKRANFDGSSPEAMVNSVPSVHGITINNTIGKVYWTEPNAGIIRSANLDGSGTVTLLSGTSEPSGIAYDAVSNKLYWQDSGEATFNQLNIDGSNPVLLRQGFNIGVAALDTQADKIYLTGQTSTPEIWRSDLDGSDTEVLITGLPGTAAFTLDPTNGKMYWSDNDNDLIRRANLDGTNIHTILDSADGVDNVGQMAISPSESKLYFTDYGATSINKSNFDGTSPQNITPGGSIIYSLGVAVDYAKGKMFYSDAGYQKISVANLDGTNATDIVTTGLTLPTHVALDTVNNKIYWLDITAKRIERANLDGSNREVVLTSVHGILSFSLYLDNVFSVSGNISLGNLDGTSLEGVIVSDGTRQTTTDANGNFTLTGVPSGNYSLTFTKSGYTFSGTTAITVSVSSISGVNIEAKPTLVSSSYTFWNGFLDQTNILELVNVGASAATVQLTLYDANGNPTISSASTHSFTVPAEGQFDVIINELEGFTRNAYGILKVEMLSGQVDARMSFYKSRQANSFDFAFTLPVDNAITGTSYLLFNTHFPNATDSSAEVLQWLTIANLSTTNTKSFTLNRYSETGSLLLSTIIDVPPLGRVDIEGGHENPGSNRVGLNQIIPSDTSAPYIAKIVRYGVKDEYVFAIPQVATSSTAATQRFIASGGANAINWLELANTSNTTKEVNVLVYSNAGDLLDSSELELPAYAQTHLWLSGFIQSGQSGYVELSTSTANSVVAQSAFYYVDPDSEEVTSATLAPALECFGTKVIGSYNLFLEMSNWLRVRNVSGTTQSLTLNVYSEGHAPTQEIFNLSANQGLDLGLQEAEYGTSSNSYDQFSLEVNDSGSICADMLRIRSDASGEIDLTMSTQVR